MKETAVPIPDATFDRLQALAARTGRTATFYIQQAIEAHLEDLEDAYDAEQAVIEHHKSGARTLSLDEFERYSDVDN